MQSLRDFTSASFFWRLGVFKRWAWLVFLGLFFCSLRMADLIVVLLSPLSSSLSSAFSGSVLPSGLFIIFSIFSWPARTDDSLWSLGRGFLLFRLLLRWLVLSPSSVSSSTSVVEADSASVVEYVVEELSGEGFLILIFRSSPSLVCSPLLGLVIVG